MNDFVMNMIWCKVEIQWKEKAGLSTIRNLVRWNTPIINVELKKSADDDVGDDKHVDDGEDVDDAISMAKEAIEGFIACMIARGEEVPVESDDSMICTVAVEANA